MNIKLQNSLDIFESKLDNHSSTFYPKTKKLEFKSIEKEQNFFKKEFPKIFTEISKKKKEPENSVSKVEQKVKEISLSVQSYNKYMVNYKNLLKYPPNNYYSTSRIKDYIPFNMIKNTNLNKRNNLYSTLNDFCKMSNFILYNRDKNNFINDSKDDDNKNILNYKKIISKTNYGNKSPWKSNIVNKDKNDDELNDKEIFKYFIEGTFLSEPEKIKCLKINEKKLYPHKLNQNDFDFYEKYLENLPKNENYTDNKKKEFELDILYNIKLKFILELKSLCLLFEEIDINNINNNKNVVNDKININYNDKKKNIQMIYLPFKYLALFFLLDYSSFKSFISEIITYDIEKNKFNIKVNDKVEKIIKKYTEYSQNKINMFNNENNTSVFDEIIYYQNEFHFNYIFPWMIYDNRNEDVKVKCFKLKIVYPTINFQPQDFGIKFQKFSSKWLIFELIKNNFIFWDRYLLYILFMNKKFRNTISYIINKKRNHISYEYSIKMIGTMINDKIAKKNNFDFFITDILKDKNHLYFFVPFKASISTRKHSQYNLNDSICLKLIDTRKIYNLSGYFGLIATFNKCMFYNKLTKKYYFSFKFLKDITQEYISLLKNDNILQCVVNKNYKQVFKYNGKEYHLIIRECLLCEKLINEYNYSEFRYYKIPGEILDYVLEKEIYNDDLYNLLIKKSNKILKLEEIEEYREYFLKKNYLRDSSSSLSKASKDKNKKKGKNLSNISITRIEKNDKNLENMKLIQLRQTSNDIKQIRTNNKNQLNNHITRKNSELDKFKEKTKNQQFIEVFSKFKDNKKDKVRNQNKSITKIINTNQYNTNNIDNIYKNSQYGNFLYKDKFVNNNINVSNKKQLELMRIRRNTNIGNYDYNNDIEKLKFNLKNK